MRRRRRAKEGQEKRKREKKRLILKMLCAAHLRLFKGQHSEKTKGSARGNWDPQEGQQPFRPNPNRVGDRTTTLRRLLIGAALRVSLAKKQNLEPGAFRRQKEHLPHYFNAYLDIKKFLTLIKFFTFDMACYLQQFTTFMGKRCDTYTNLAIKINLTPR